MAVPRPAAGRRGDEREVELPETKRSISPILPPTKALIGLTVRSRALPGRSGGELSNEPIRPKRHCGVPILGRVGSLLDKEKNSVLAWRASGLSWTWGETSLACANCSFVLG